MAVSGVITSIEHDLHVCRNRKRGRHALHSDARARDAGGCVVAFGRCGGCGRKCLHRGDAKRCHPQSKRGHGAYFYAGREWLRQTSTPAGFFRQCSFTDRSGSYLDGSGNLYVADTLDMVVREIQGNFAALDFTTPVRAGRNLRDANGDRGKRRQCRAGSDQHYSGNQRRDRSNSGQLVYKRGVIACGCGVRDRCGVCAGLDAHAHRQSNRDAQQSPWEKIRSRVLPRPIRPLDIELVGTAEPVNSTTTTITSIPNPSGFGQSVTFTVTVITGAGTGSLTERSASPTHSAATPQHWLPVWP